jgi:hypothetical protein
VHLALEGFYFLRNSNDTILEAAMKALQIRRSSVIVYPGPRLEDAVPGALKGADDTFMDVASVGKTICIGIRIQGVWTVAISIVGHIQSSF